jgi:hypothetical protein
VCPNLIEIIEIIEILRLLGKENIARMCDYFNKFNNFNKKYARISALQALLNHALMSLLFQCNKVAAPIHLQFKSNSSPIGNWRKMGLT